MTCYSISPFLLLVSTGLTMLTCMTNEKFYCKLVVALSLVTILASAMVLFEAGFLAVTARGWATFGLVVYLAWQANRSFSRLLKEQQRDHNRITHR